MIPGYLNKQAAAEYAGVSKGTIRNWMKDGLRHIRRGNVVLIKPEWIDDFLEPHEDMTYQKLKKMVDEMVRKLT